MVKKISALFLALILCLSVMVVPVSAAPAIDGEASVGVLFEYLDKDGNEITSIQPGQVITVNIYATVAAEGEALSAAKFQIWFNNAQYECLSYEWVGPIGYLAASSSSAVITSGTVFNNVSNKMTDEEKAYGWNAALYMQFILDKTVEGSYLIKENEGTPMATAQFKVLDSVAYGTAAPIGAPLSSIWAKSRATYNYVQTTNIAAPSSTEGVTLVTPGNNFEAKIPACETHTWDEGEVKTAATCGAAGEMLYTCTVCNSTKTEAIEATGNHTAGNPVDENVVSASCSEAGSKDVVVYCSVCEAEMSRTATTIPATGDHNFANEVERVEPTCTEDGYYVMACGCGQKADPVTLPAAGHTEAEAVVENEVDATCTVDGSYDTVVYCSVCDTELSRETTTVTAEGHKYGTEVTAPTCTEAGYTTYTCSVCGDTYTADEVEALGHEYEVAFVKQPTCAKDGYTRYTCSVCEDTYQEEIPSKNHTNEDGSSALVEIPAIPATCKAPGYTAGERCTICNTQTVVPTLVQKAEHTWDEGVVTEPTYSSQGYTFYTCTVCSETKKEYIPALSVEFTFEIAAPSVTTLRARDTIVLHPVFEGEVAEGVTVEWSVDNENFKIVEVYEDGSVKVEAKKVVKGTDGVTTFTATAVDAEGNEITSDTVELTANAKFFQQFLGFFRAIFGLAKHYEA